MARVVNSSGAVGCASPSTLGVTSARPASMNYSNVVRDFALRTRKNLAAIDALVAANGEAFEVTQLINSMLGLLVFPQQKYVDSIPKTTLAELEQKGWPIPKIRGEFEQVQDLNQLIRYLRNAVAHFNIQFIDDGRGNIAVLRVWNMAPVKERDGRIRRDANRRTVEQKNWEAELGVSELRGIADRFIDLLLEQE
jgi:HEPN pEK499 p136